jgi:hypothetical protein
MAEQSGARKVVLIISSDRGLCDSVDKVVARAKCRAVAVRDSAAAERAIERVRPVLILVDPVRRDELPSQLRAMCTVAELPVRSSGSGVRRLAKPSSEAVRWLTGLIAERCASTT